MTGETRERRWLFNTRAHLPGQPVPVTCWCEAEFIYVTLEEVAEGRTASCGAPNCHPPAA